MSEFNRTPCSSKGEMRQRGRKKSRRRYRATKGGESADAFAERLFTETGTAVAPGRFFGAPRHFRIAFGGDPRAVADGLAAIARTLDSP